jgi:hypothetical protein
VTIKFNSYEVPGSPFYCNIVDLNKITVANYDSRSAMMFPIYKVNSVELNSIDLSAANLNTKLTSPSGSHLPVSKSPTSQSTVKISFQANELGMNADFVF